jgi:signal peptidase I
MRRAGREEARAGTGRPRRRRRWLWSIAVLLVMLAMTPSYLRAFRVGGPSDAPTYLMNDLVLVNKAAYDLRLPYSGIVLLSHSDPVRGDVVLYRVPGEGSTVFKRIVGCPGDVVEMKDNHLSINQEAIRYETENAEDYSDVAGTHGLGSMVEIEIGLGPDHTVSHSGGEWFGPVSVPPDHYFMMGDNRDNSRDSRLYGPVPRQDIVGKLSRPYLRGSP